MNNTIRVYRDRANAFEVDLGHPVGDDVYTSQIREAKNKNSPLVATWLVSPSPRKNRLLFWMSEETSGNVSQTHGWMDIKRVSGGYAFPLLNYPLEVLFLNSITE